MVKAFVAGLFISPKEQRLAYPIPYSGYQLSLVIRHSREGYLWWELPAKAGIQT